MPRSELNDSDRQELAEFIERHWYGPEVITLGRNYLPHKEKGFVERRDGRIVAALTYCVDGDAMLVLTVNSTLEGQGIGSSLLLEATEQARRMGCSKIRLATTNDNLRAIGFYQRLGFRIVGVRLGSVDEMRKTKPRIPAAGERGIPIQDEIILELPLQPYLGSAAEA